MSQIVDGNDCFRAEESAIFAPARFYGFGSMIGSFADDLSDRMMENCGWESDRFLLFSMNRFRRNSIAEILFIWFRNNTVLVMAVTMGEVRGPLLEF